jgi:hypothetical protein
VDLSAIAIAALRDALAVAETGVSAVPKAAVPSRAQLEAAEKRGYERGLAEGRAQGLQEVIAAIKPLLVAARNDDRPDARSRTISDARSLRLKSTPDARSVRLSAN